MSIDRGWLRALAVFALCCVGSLLSAMLFLAVQPEGLPRPDSSWGRIQLEIATMIALGLAVLLFPVAVVVLRDRRLSTSFAFVQFCVLAEIALVAPIYPAGGFFFAFFVLFLSLRFVVISKRACFRPTPQSGSRPLTG